MKKLKIVAVFVAIIALTVVSGEAMKPAATEHAEFGVVPGSEVADIEGEGVVGTNVWTYSPEPIELYLTENVVQYENQVGSNWGFARCLKKNSARLDFFFDCSGPDLVDCDYRLMVLDGIYDRELDVAVFDPGTMYLDFQGETVKAGTASFSIAFSENGGGGEEPAGSENGGQCKDGKDNDGDGLIDCDDPDCYDTKWCS